MKKKISSIPKLISPRLPVLSWLDKKIILRGWEFPLKRIVLPIAVLFFCVALTIYAFAFGRGSQAIDQKAALEKEIETLTGKISSFMELPKEEQPTLATVTDQSKLKDQDFFSSAQNGDKLLIYPKSKKALLYRPSTGKLVDVANLTSGEKESEEIAEDDYYGEKETIEYVD